MNNIEEFYSMKKLLDLIMEYSHHHNCSLFYDVHYDEKSVEMELNDKFVRSIKENEATDIKYIIKEWLHERKEEIEDYVINKIKIRLEESKEKVKKDFEWKDKEVKVK